MPKTTEDRISVAQAAFEAGFASKAAQKRALDELNSAYSNLRRDLMNAILDARSDANEEENHADYWGVPSDLHQVRERHLTIVTRYGFSAPLVRDLIALRASIKAAAIAPAPAKSDAEQKVEAVRKTIREEMEARKAQFVEGMTIARLFNGLPVSVNAHWVHGHKGTNFIRYFFYLAGELTPLNMIMAIAETYQAEKEGAK